MRPKFKVEHPESQPLAPRVAEGINTLATIRRNMWLQLERFIKVADEFAKDVGSERVEVYISDLQAALDSVGGIVFEPLTADLINFVDASGLIEDRICVVHDKDGRVVEALAPN